VLKVTSYSPFVTCLNILLVIVGVNKYKPPSNDPMEVRTIDNSAVRAAQVERINRIKATRNADDVKRALAALTEAAKSGTGNLLELAIIASRARATVGEISDALEAVYGRYHCLC
jgi:methylmalonyl-CoA mutase